MTQGERTSIGPSSLAPPLPPSLIPHPPPLPRPTCCCVRPSSSLRLQSWKRTQTFSPDRAGLGPLKETVLCEGLLWQALQYFSQQQRFGCFKSRDSDANATASIFSDLSFNFFNYLLKGDWILQLTGGVETISTLGHALGDNVVPDCTRPARPLQCSAVISSRCT